jgi:pyridoxamine 5'-phosphate oxidase
MKAEDVLSFIKENPVCAIATVEGDQPRVRWFLSLLFDDGKIYFTTGATKSVWKQMAANPKVELCYIAPNFSRMLRITGVIEEVDDKAKKQKLIETQDYLKGFSADDPIYKLLRVVRGKARFWTMTDNLRESELKTVEI